MIDDDTDFPNPPIHESLEPMGPICCLCYAEEELVDAPCSEKPELLIGVPLGMYHCPECGSMLCAGFPHGQMCKGCAKKSGV
jgi:hypothetical protein